MFAVHIFPRVTLVLAGAEPHQRSGTLGSGALQLNNNEQANTPMKIELYLGLDVDKEWMVIAVAEWGRTGAVHDLGAISNDLHALEKLLARLRKRWRP